MALIRVEGKVKAEKERPLAIHSFSTATQPHASIYAP